ncbi:MAG: hypothetical protein ACLQVI_33320 [Polyangiaceae bacterium]|jgi:hypothetical protein
MTRIGLLALMTVLGVPAAPQAVTRAPSPPPPPGALPSIPRVRIDVASDHIVATEDVDLPRGDWGSGDLSFYVAFGGPGAPEAFDAHLLTVPDGALEPADGDVGAKLVAEPAPHRPATVRDLIGADEMAGVVVHVPEGAFRHAVAPGGMAALRLRTLLGFPAGNARTGHDVLVRLGHTRTTPLTLGRVQVSPSENGPTISRAEAHLCGDDADPWPLAIAIGPKRAAPELVGSQAPIAPVLAVRHPSDDLCVRFWLVE